MTTLTEFYEIAAFFHWKRDPTAAYLAQEFPEQEQDHDYWLQQFTYVGVEPRLEKTLNEIASAKALNLRSLILPISTFSRAIGNHGFKVALSWDIFHSYKLERDTIACHNANRLTRYYDADTDHTPAIFNNGHDYAVFFCREKITIFSIDGRPSVSAFPDTPTEDFLREYWTDSSLDRVINTVQKGKNAISFEYRAGQTTKSLFLFPPEGEKTTIVYSREALRQASGGTSLGDAMLGVIQDESELLERRRRR